MTLVLGGTGKMGSRVAERLWNAAGPVRLGHRSGEPRFDWTDAATWHGALAGVTAAYVTYQPDLMLPQAADRVAALAREAVAGGARRLVLLSRRGDAQRAEEAFRASGADWTVIRASWFMQNFSEGAFGPAVIDGRLELPVGEVGEPFIDAEDIADVVLRVLGDVRYIGRTLELTGPCLLTFRDAVAEIARAAGRPIEYQRVTRSAFLKNLAQEGVDAETRSVMAERFTTLFDGRNAAPTADLEAVLGRPARDFGEFATEAARRGVWNNTAAAAHGRAAS